jgi:hypothetical protein
VTKTPPKTNLRFFFGIFSKKTHFRIFTRLVPLKSFFYKCLSLWVDVVFARSEDGCFYVLFYESFCEVRVR